MHYIDDRFGDMAGHDENFYYNGLGLHGPGLPVPGRTIGQNESDIYHNT